MTDLYRALVEQGPDAIIFADREGIIRLWNARAEEMFGYAASEAVGRSLDLIIPPHLRAAHWQGYRQAIAAGRTRSVGRPMLTRATHQDGSKLYVEVAFGIVCDKQQGVLGALATARKSSKPPKPSLCQWNWLSIRISQPARSNSATSDGSMKVA